MRFINFIIIDESSLKIAVFVNLLNNLFFYIVNHSYMYLYIHICEYMCQLKIASFCAYNTPIDCFIILRVLCVLSCHLLFSRYLKQLTHKFTLIILYPKY